MWRFICMCAPLTYLQGVVQVLDTVLAFSGYLDGFLWSF